jgi:hypothetical protein
MLASILLALSISRLWLTRNTGPGLFSFLSFSSYFAYLVHRPVWRLAYLCHSPRTQIGTFAFTMAIGSPLAVLASFALQKIYNRCLSAICASRRVVV